MRFFYFAYGSNMNGPQMTTRCPDSEFVSIARLNNWEFAFNAYSEDRQGGVANIVAQDKAFTWGVVYEISTEDLHKLDGFEGYKEGRPSALNDYERTALKAVDVTSKELSCQVYIANTKGQEEIPAMEYLDIIVKGAQEFSIPHTHIQKIITLSKLLYPL